MLFSDAICVALLTITVTATCVEGGNAKQELAERRPEKRSRRESAVLIDSYSPITFKPQPEIMFKRISKTKYRKPKPKYGPPRTKYTPPHKSRKPLLPVKKYRRKQVRANKIKKRIPKPKHGHNKKPLYGPPKQMRPYPYYAPEPVGFGEPPKEFPQKYVQPQSYGEPPVDSYGIPLKSSVGNFPAAESIAESTDYNDIIGQRHQSYQSFQQDLNIDNNKSNSKHHPIYTVPHALSAVSPPKYEDFNIDNYEDLYGKHSSPKDHSYKLFQQGMQKNRPWKSKGKVEEDDHIMVGGQYAEPPGRLVPSFHPSAPMLTGANEFSPLAYLDSEVAASATISPYVNYKHSNMAFSPQNLNDAFSILN